MVNGRAAGYYKHNTSMGIPGGSILTSVKINGP